MIGRRRDVLQRHDRDAVAGLRLRAAASTRPVPDRVGRRHQTIAALIAHQRDTAQPQRAFQHEQQIGLRHRPAGRQGHGALHARIDQCSRAEGCRRARPWRRRRPACSRNSGHSPRRSAPAARRPTFGSIRAIVPLADDRSAGCAPSAGALVDVVAGLLAESAAGGRSRGPCRTTSGGAARIARW